MLNRKRDDKGGVWKKSTPSNIGLQVAQLGVTLAAGVTEVQKQTNILFFCRVSRCVLNLYHIFGGFQITLHKSYCTSKK